MTHLYRLDCNAADIAQRFGARAGDDPWQGGYIAPMKFAPVVTAGREFVAGSRPSDMPFRPRIIPRLWGVGPPPNADDPMRRIAHVRNPDSPFWIGNLRNSEFRCLIPATSVMLWGSETDYEGRRLRHWFAPERGFAPEGFAPEAFAPEQAPNPQGNSTGQPIFAMLGIWKDEEVPGFAILTQDARGAAKDAGCRSMPIILPDHDDAQRHWLRGGWDKARQLIERPAPVPLAQLPERGFEP